MRKADFPYLLVVGDRFRFRFRFFRSALSTGSLWIEETSEEEETPAVEAPRAKKRKAGGPPELPT